jgi:hypothetical protein
MIGGYHYVGGMKDGLRHGYGKIKWLDDNTSYEGDWSHGYPLMEKKENRIMDGNDSQAGEIVIPKMNKMFCYLLNKDHYNHQPISLLMKSGGSSSIGYQTRETISL